MISSLVINEVKNSLLSMRFVIGLMFVLLVYTGSSFIFCRKYLNQKENDLSNEQQYQTAIEAGQQGLQALYQNGIPIAKHQELSSFFASGNETRFPNSFIVAPYAPQAAMASGGMAVRTIGKNYKLENYTDFDIAFIVGIVLSFLALVLSFDAVSHDREEGTLKQQLSNPVLRWQILLGKYVAILILLLITVFMSSLLNILIFEILLGENVLTSFPLETMLSGILAIIYLSIFIWLGIWVSASVSKSSTSLALLLLVWITLVVLFPYIGGMIVQGYSPVTSQRQSLEQFQALLAGEQLPVESYDFFKGKGREEAWPIVEHFLERRDADMERFVVHRFMELTNQALKAESYNFFSPYGAFKQAMEHCSNTGLPYHVKFYNAVRGYLSDLVGFIREEDKLDPESKHQIAAIDPLRSMSSKPVDPQIIPHFKAPTRYVSASDIVQTVPAIGYLLILNVLFFFLALYAFHRMDVR